MTSTRTRWNSALHGFYWSAGVFVLVFVATMFFNIL